MIEVFTGGVVVTHPRKKTKDPDGVERLQTTFYHECIWGRDHVHREYDSYSSLGPAKESVTCLHGFSVAFDE